MAVNRGICLLLRVCFVCLFATATWLVNSGRRDNKMEMAEKLHLITAARRKRKTLWWYFFYIYILPPCCSCTAVCLFVCLACLLLSFNLRLMSLSLMLIFPTDTRTHIFPSFTCTPASFLFYFFHLSVNEYILNVEACAAFSVPLMLYFTRACVLSFHIFLFFFAPLLPPSCFSSFSGSFPLFLLNSYMYLLLLLLLFIYLLLRNVYPLVYSHVSPASINAKCY
uniref:Uncharacterized protein TCIL3000_1_1120 n=1 Tax=Trypanosoma congolense (strain IL3000) TaxID=1068625 RepID=G0UIZ4_TRYCI|nr:unnamed protein product [Trypanosoma congolense IL3000]